ncbi:MAG: response regulator [Microscillaceae bacterium]|nr:response regulator [Microscillaceae bacterium]MDW8461771.1 response regulator [Cytophagales bacterium]
MQKVGQILLIDDDPVSNLICENLFKRTSICQQIKAFTQAQAALKYLDEVVQRNLQLPEVIFLDLNMPIMNGWDFLEKYATQIATKLPHRIKIYILTSSIDKADKKEAEKIDWVTGFVIKPFTEEKLLKIFE